MTNLYESLSGVHGADIGHSGADEVGAEADVQRVPVGGAAAAGGRHHRQPAQLLQVRPSFLAPDLSGICVT